MLLHNSADQCICIAIFTTVGDVYLIVGLT